MSEETNIMAGLETDASIEQETDSLGGFQVLNSDLYNCMIESCFLTVSQGGARAFNLRAKTLEKKSIQQQFWMTSGTAKGCKNHYVGKDGTKHYLPGFNMANAICVLTLDKEISKLSCEAGVAEMFGEKVKVDYLPELAGKPITLGVIKQIVDKRAKNDVTGEYEPTGDTREENEVDKVFRAADGLTTTEIRGGLTEAKFKEQWLDKWKDEVKDKSTKVEAGVAAPAAGAPVQQTQAVGAAVPPADPAAPLFA